MRNNQFCGSCRGKIIPSSWGRALFCPHCGRTIYLRLTCYADHHISYYALIVGFTEIGETLEGTVRREVKEETGLSAKDIRYYKF